MCLFKQLNILFFIFISLILSCTKTGNDEIKSETKLFEKLLSPSKVADKSSKVEYIKEKTNTKKTEVSTKPNSRKIKKHNKASKNDKGKEVSVFETLRDLKSIRSYLIKQDSEIKAESKIAEIKLIVENKKAANVGEIKKISHNKLINNKLEGKLKKLEDKANNREKQLKTKNDFLDVDALIDEVEIEPDYIFAESSISGLSYDLDLKIRAELYEKNKLIADKNLENLTITSLKKSEKNSIILKEPELEEPKVLVKNETLIIDDKKATLISRLENISSENISNSKIKNKKNFAQDIGTTIDIGQLKKETEKLFLSSSFDKKGDSESESPLRSIIASSEFKESLKSSGDSAENINIEEEITKRERMHTYNASQKLVAASSPIVSDTTSELERKIKTPNSVNLTGKIEIPSSRAEYSNGYVDVYLLDKMGPKGYSHDYPKDRKITLPIKGRTSIPFSFENLKGGDKKYIAAEIFPTELRGNYSSENSDMFIGLPEQNPQILSDNINDIKITFPKLNNFDKNKSSGQIIIDSKNKTLTQSEIKNTEVSVIGSSVKAYTDKDGTFSVPISSTREFGINYEIFGREFYPSIFSTCSNSGEKLSVYFLNEVDGYLDLLKEFNIIHLNDRGIILGKLVSDEKVEGIEVDLSVTNVDGPFYFDKNGELDLSLERTSSDGRFIYFNVPEGLKIIGPHVNKEELPGASIEVEVDKLSYVEINIDTRVQLEGYVINALGKENDRRVKNAEVSIIGAPNEDSVITDEKGYFKFSAVRAINNINTIEVVKEGFSPTRITKCISNKTIEIYIFPYEDMHLAKTEESSESIGSLLREHGLKQDPSKGLVMGSIMHGGELMIDISPLNTSQIIYFDELGNIDLERKKTAPIDGNFIILNVPPGQKNIIAYDAKGEVKNYFTIRASQSVINSVYSY